MISEVIDLSIPLPRAGPNPDDLQKVTNNYLKLVLGRIVSGWDSNLSLLSSGIIFPCLSRFTLDQALDWRRSTRSSQKESWSLQSGFP